MDFICHRQISSHSDFIRVSGIYSKPSPVGEGGIRAFASMTDEVFAFPSSNFPSGILCPDTSSTASGPPSSYNARRCMKSFRRNVSHQPEAVYHHGSAVYIIRVSGISTQILTSSRYPRPSPEERALRSSGGVYELDARRYACACPVRIG